MIPKTIKLINKPQNQAITHNLPKSLKIPKLPQFRVHNVLPKISIIKPHFQHYPCQIPLGEVQGSFPQPVTLIKTQNLTSTCARV